MAQKSCFDILSKIKETVAKISFEDDVRLEELLQRTVTCDRERIEKLKQTRQKAQQDKEEEEENVAALKAKLNRAKDEKEKVQQNIAAIKNMKPQGIPIENKEDYDKYKQLLKVYTEVTGTHAIHKQSGNAVIGFVGVKGSTPHESKLLPFNFKATDPDVPDKIWEKIHQATVTENDEIEEQLNELSRMEIA